MKLFIEMKGPVPRKLLRKAAFRENHYDQEGVFSLIEDDPVTHRQIRRLIRDAEAHQGPRRATRRPRQEPGGCGATEGVTAGRSAR